MSRLFKRFQEKGWVSGQGKEVEIENMSALKLMAGRADPDRSEGGRRVN
jgi:hypothetical protein